MTRLWHPGRERRHAPRARAIITIFITLTVFTALAVAHAADPDLEFVYEVVDPSPPSGTGCCLDVCALGDIDGDGVADVVIGSENSIGVVWYHSPDWTRYVIGAGSFTTDGETADVDGDGDTDVVISCVSRGQIEWWENLSSPFVTSGWSLHKVGDNFSHDVAVGDISGDGRLDVIVFRKDTEVLWFQAPADPRGVWTSRSIASSSGEGLDVGDLDGDGDTDVAASRWWYDNSDGAGTSWTKRTVTSNWGDDCRDIVADIDGDGDRDIVLSHSESSGRVSWFENPVWAEHAVETGTLVGAHSLEAVDFDRDGDFDVVTGEMHTSSQKRVFVYRNDGAGAAWTRLALAITGTHNVRVGDVTGDNKPDIVGKNYDGPKSVELWENSVALAVSVGPTGAPRFELGGNYPNPFSEDTSIPYHLVAAADVTLIVYGVTGWKYATLIDGRKNAGGHVADWNGRGRDGSRLRSGVYFYRMTSGGVAQTKKMVILR